MVVGVAFTIDFVFGVFVGISCVEE